MNVIDGRTITEDMRYDAAVVIVGSGPAGAAVARRLAVDYGVDVLVLEEGVSWLPRELPADGFTSMARLYRDMGASVTRGQAPMPFLQGSALGGTSVVNGAISWRLPRDVYAEWVDRDPALSEYMPWDDIEAELDRVEKRLSIGPTDDGIAGENNRLLAKGAEALGLEHRPIRRNVSGCRGLGRCLQGCPEGKKLSMDRSYLPDAVGHGARVIMASCVTKLLHRRGRASGVEAKAGGGGTITVRADNVVLAASAVQTPALLIRSGLRHGPVGEGFQAHPGASMAGYFTTPVRVWEGATQGHEVIGLRREGIKFEALGFDVAVAATRLKSVGKQLSAEIAEVDHWAHWGAAVRATSRGRVRPALRGGASVRYNVSKDDMKKVRRGVAVLGEMMLAAGAEYVTPGVYGWDELVSSRERMRSFEQEGPLDPRAYAMVITHMFGTCRMGADPRQSVVRPDFRHHHVEGLWVADSSVFPTNTGVNPQTSIIALASICGTRVAGALDVPRRPPAGITHAGGSRAVSGIA